LDPIAARQLRDEIVVLYDLLIQAYGPKPERKHDALNTLVATILSQNTNDVNRDQAFKELRRRFPDWEAVREAEPVQIVDAIRVAGLANQKGPRIQEALRIITERAGQLSLDFLADMELDEARRWLVSINGIGPKTAAIVLCFAFGKPAFPVDTHIHRVTKRIGLIGPQVNREQAHVILESLVPPELCYAFHINLIEHGRRVCKAPRPLCEICNLRDHCNYYHTVFLYRGERL
jgi:endonuclease-3